MASGSTAMLRRAAQDCLCQARAEHLQQCAEFLPLRNRGLGPLAVTVLSILFARRAAATACNRQRPFFVAGDRQGFPLFVRSPREELSRAISSVERGSAAQITREKSGRTDWKNCRWHFHTAASARAVHESTRSSGATGASPGFPSVQQPLPHSLVCIFY